MTDTHRLAQLITACWRVSGGDPLIPTSHGMLDRALKKTWESGSFPDWARKRLHFVDSRIGLQCVEVPGILEWAQRSQLTSVPNPSYQTTEVKISDKVAKQLLQKLDVNPEDAKKWGESLRKALIEIEHTQSHLEQALIEEY